MIRMDKMSIGRGSASYKQAVEGDSGQGKQGGE